MIFVGDGALLQQAVSSALTRGYRVDGVFGNSDRLGSFCARHRVPFAAARDLQADPSRARSMCSDGVGFSIDNALLLQASFLASAGISFFGIHSGILPIQRGDPIVAAIFAILDGSPEYGVSLYELDAAIDAGEILAIERFAISPEMRLHELILRCADLSQRMFDDHVNSIARRTYRGRVGEVGATRLYTSRDLGSPARLPRPRRLRPGHGSRPSRRRLAARARPPDRGAARSPRPAPGDHRRNRSSPPLGRVLAGSARRPSAPASCCRRRRCP